MNADAMAQMQTDLSNLMVWNGSDSMTWNGGTYPVLASRLSRSEEMDDGGIWQNYAGRLVCRLRDFQTYVGATWVTGTTPRTNGRLTFRGETLKIERTVIDDGVGTVTIHLSRFGSPMRG